MCPILNFYLVNGNSDIIKFIFQCVYESPLLLIDLKNIYNILDKGKLVSLEYVNGAFCRLKELKLTSEDVRNSAL